MANLTGRWIGHYYDPNTLRSNCGPDEDRHAFPITAEFTQNGDRIEGTMTDGVTLFDASMKDYFEVEGHNYSEVGRELTQAMIDIDPNAVIASTLPEKSRLSGMVKGQGVTFRKTYLGKSEVEFRYEGKVEVSRTDIPAPVEYSGKLENDDTIRGIWIIWEYSWFGRRKKIDVEGTFLLQRA